MDELRIHLDSPQPRIITAVTEALDNSGLVLVPGDTSYLILAAIGDKAALEKLNRLKQSKKRKYYSIMVPSLKILSKFAEITDSQYTMLRHCLPGPYTFIVKASREVPKIMLEKRKEIGIRIPDSLFLQMLLDEYEKPFIVSTASTYTSEKIFCDPENDRPEWLHYINLLIDGGYLPAELTSVIRFDAETYEILREGKGSVQRFE